MSGLHCEHYLTRTRVKFHKEKPRRNETVHTDLRMSGAISMAMPCRLRDTFVMAGWAHFVSASKEFETMLDSNRPAMYVMAIR